MPAPPRPPDQLLDHLASQCAAYAAHMLRTVGEVPPTLVALNAEGVLFCSPGRLDGIEDKDRFAKVMHLVAIGWRAVAVAVVLESWAVFAKKDGSLPQTLRPSLSPDRREVVVVSVESRAVNRQRFFAILRDAAGRFTRLSGEGMPEYDSAQGRFANVIPPVEPDAAQAGEARQLLEAMGVRVENRGPDPLWN